MTNKEKGKNKEFTKSKANLGDQLYEAEMKEKMYFTIYEELNCSDDTDLDTELINECVNALDDIMMPSKRITEPDVDAFIQQTLGKHEQIKSEKLKRNRKKMLRRVAGFVIVFILSNVMIAQALDIHIWKSVIQWGEETFNLKIKKNDDLNLQYEANESGSKEYESIEEAIAKLGVQAMVPKYVPEGYVLQYVEVNKISAVTDITGVFSYQDKMFFYTIQILASNTGDVDKTYEKDKEIFEVYQKEGIDFYIMSNFEQGQAVWNISNEVYTLNGDLTIEEIKKMLDSLK